MDLRIKLIISLINLTALTLLIIVAGLGDFLYKRMDKPGYIPIIRVISWLTSFFWFFYIVFTIERTRHFIDDTLYHASLPIGNIISRIADLVMSSLMIFIFIKYLLYYMRYDRKGILTGWYMNQYMHQQSSLLKEKKYDEAYQYALNIAQLQPESVFLWCNLATISEYFMHTPDKSDQHLLKAKEILDACKEPADSEKAVFECYCGFIQQHRGNFRQGLEHMKKAYDLDPRPYRKKEYKKAVEMVNTNSSDSNETE